MLLDIWGGHTLWVGQKYGLHRAPTWIWGTSFYEGALVKPLFY
jgi:hypothetical protein